jgi:hypothetical protein
MGGCNKDMGCGVFLVIVLAHKLSLVSMTRNNQLLVLELERPTKMLVRIQ